MTRWRIRAATAEDAHAIARIHVRSWQQAYHGLIDQAVLAGLSIEDRTHTWAQRLPQPSTQTEARDQIGAPVAPSSTDAGHITLVAEAQDQIAAWATYGPGRDDELSSLGELSGLYADPQFYGTGAGHLLIKEVQHALHSSGYEQSYLWILRGNERTLRFYTAHGWVPDGGSKTETLASGTLIQADRLRLQLS